MKHKSAFVATLLYLTAIHSLNVYAASDTAGDTKNDANAPQDQPKKKVEPHSHLEEKMGVISKKPEETKEVETASDAVKPKKTNPAKDQSRHYHSRDAK